MSCFYGLEIWGWREYEQIEINYKNSLNKITVDYLVANEIRCGMLV